MNQLLMAAEIESLRQQVTVQHDVGMRKDALLLQQAAEIERLNANHEQNEHLAIDLAKLLRKSHEELHKQAAEIEQVRADRDSLYKAWEAAFGPRSFGEVAAEIERLKTTPPDKREDLRCVISDLTDDCQRKDALLKECLSVLEAHQEYGSPTLLTGAKAVRSIVNIKTELGGNHG